MTPLPTRLTEQIHRSAIARPTATAVEMAGAGLTYAELAGRSDRYAHALRRAGIGSGAAVAVSLSRSPDLVAVLLAIAKAGAAYLPVDPGFPADRRRFMLSDGGARLHLTDENWRPMLAGGGDGTSDGPSDGIPDDRFAEATTVGNDDLAYVIYTSGSTGQPKGVEITHGGLANVVSSLIERPGIAAGDRVLAHTTLSFDIHVLEVWAPLAAGATVVMVSSETAGDPAALGRAIEDGQLSVVQATPSMWALMLRAGWHHGNGIRALAGGEALPRDLADALLATGAEVWNLYGPTETTVWSAIARVHPHGPIVIGEPVARTTLHVLSASLDEQPAGAVGELGIGGAGLARGYRGRPDLTAARFVTLPADGRRIYRTGDLARRLADGTIECLGRIDQQVKVGGNRIEPGEVEAALRAVDGVRDAVVVAADGALGLRQLVAYLVLAADRYADTGTDSDADRTVIRRAKAMLTETLPDYMVPSLFVPLAALPLTPNGKLDRTALPAPPAAVSADDTPPATPSERALQTIWCEVFGTTGIGVRENFFDAGGHSRLAAWLLALVADRLDVRLPLTRLVDAPTIRQLAAVIDAGGGVVPDAMVTFDPGLQVQGGAEVRPLFLVHAAGGHAVIYRDLAAHLARHVPLVVLQARGLDGREPPRTTVADMATAYIRLLRARQPRGPYALGGASFGGVVAWHMAVQLRQAGEVVDLLLMMDTAYPPVGATTGVRALARLPGFERQLYPLLRRVMSHAAAARRLGPTAYIRWLRRDRREDDLRTGQRITQQVGTVGQSLLDALAHVRDANERALANYLPPDYDGEVLFLFARDGRDEHDTRFTWRRCGRRIEYRAVPGNHGTMLLEPHVADTATHVRTALLNRDRSAVSAATRPLPPPRRQDHLPV